LSAAGGVGGKARIEVSPVHMPKRFSTFLVSTLCIFAASTVKTGAANRDGMLAETDIQWAVTIRRMAYSQVFESRDEGRDRCRD